MTTLFCGSCKKNCDAKELVKYARYECLSCGAINEVTNISIKEWIGFNYEEYTEEVLRAIQQDEFLLLRAETIDQVSKGKFSARQVDKLKSVLVKNFEKGGSIRTIRDDVLNKVKPKDLKISNKDGKVVRTISGEERALNIARTETTRVANLGAEQHYKKGDITEIVWVASVGDRTCPECLALDGSIFSVNTGPRPPLHSLCRCTIIPKTRLG